MVQPQVSEYDIGGLARRVTQTGEEAVPATLPLEEPLSIEINGRLAAVLMRTPGEEKALALGYCLSEGLIRSASEVLLLHHCGSGMEDELPMVPQEEGGPLARNRIRMTVTPEAEERLRARSPRWVFSGCGGVDAEALGTELAVAERDLCIRPEVLWDLVPKVVQAQEAYRATGGIHAAALADAGGALLALSEDVGRHNAVDKAIGQVAFAGKLPAALLVATGRASSDIVAKAAQVGVPIVASFSSSTSLAVRLAEEAGVTLIAYLRRNRFTVYSHPERIASL